MENVVTDVVPSSEYEGFMEFKLNGKQQPMLPTWAFLQDYGGKPIQVDDIKLGYTYYYTANGMVPKIFKCYYVIIYEKTYVKYNNQEICKTENNKTGIRINDNCINNYKISRSFITDDDKVIFLNNENSIIYHNKADREIGWEIYLPSIEIINNSKNKDKEKKLLKQNIEEELIDEDSASGGRKKRRTKKYRKYNTKNKKFRKLKSHRKTTRKARNNNKYNKK